MATLSTDAAPSTASGLRHGLARIGITPLELGLLGWMIFLLALPVAVVKSIPAEYLSQLYVRPAAHALMEGFCGLTAALIAATLGYIAFRRRQLAIAVFAAGFLMSGCLDIAHALTDPGEHHDNFVLLHTLSAASGGLAIFASALIAHFSTRTSETRHALSARHLVGGVILIFVVAIVYKCSLEHTAPSAAIPYAFTPLMHITHELAAALYVLSAIAFYQYYVRTKYVPALIVASMLTVFAESVYLFRFSLMWDLTWWMWHGVKVAFYFGILFTIAIGLLLSINKLESSRDSLSVTNERLRRTQRAIHTVNQLLGIRNRMSREALSAQRLDAAFSVIRSVIGPLTANAPYKLLLVLPRDEVDEFNSQIAARYQVPVVAVSDQTPMGPSAERAATRFRRLWSSVSPDATELNKAAYLPIRSEHEDLGCLIIEAGREGQPIGYTVEQQLAELTNEIGAIVKNALLYTHLMEDRVFRATLLHICASLSTTMNLDDMLRTICTESAKLLHGDGSFLFMLKRNPDTDRDTIDWIHGVESLPRAEFETLAGSIVREIAANPAHSAEGRFLTCWRGSGPAWAGNLGVPQSWGALAGLPIYDGDIVAGVLGIVRISPVRFSTVTIARGEMLAVQAGLAINRFLHHRQLASVNDQLKLEKNMRIQSEQLAIIGKLATCVAHEVRNPLGAITNCVAVLGQQIPGTDSSVDTALDIIRDEVTRLDKLTRDLLTFGTSRSSPRQPVHLSRLVLRMKESLGHYIAHKRMQVEVIGCLELRGGPDLILFDSTGLETVLWNLLLNAVQAIDIKGTVEFVLSPRPGRLLIVVRDDGSGIPRDQREEIFLPFVSHRANGAGLGLAIVRKYVDEWSGRVRIASQVGKGTTLYLRIPVTGTC